MYYKKGKLHLTQEAKINLWATRVNDNKITSMKDYYLSIEEDLVGLKSLPNTNLVGMLNHVYLSELL